VVPTREPYLHIDALQKGAFYALITLSIVYAAWRFWQRAQHWKKGRPDHWKKQPWKSIGQYILAQRKVQGSRPRSGAPMHLLIFYGFLGLLIATSLLALADYGWVIGIPYFHKGNYYLIYELVFDLVGLAFLVGVGWALARRLAYARREPRENPLTHAMQDNWALILLVSLAVSGFVVEGARMANQPKPWDIWAPVGFVVSKAMPGLPDLGYVAIWWMHSILVAGFFALLPHMRLRHIVTAVATAANAPERPMGRLEPISMEQVEETGKVGAMEASDYSRWHLMSLDACMGCGRCTEVCPAYGVGKTLNPKQVVADLHAAMVEGGPVAERITEEALWACTTCHACVEACPVLIHHVDLIADARRGLVAEGRLSGSGAVMLRQAGSTAHAWGQPAAKREEWMKGMDIPLCRDKVQFDWLFWVGCAGATDPEAVKTTQAFARLMQRAGVSFACLGQEEACTGDPVRRTGDEFLFQDLAGRNVGVFEKYGVKRVVTACPHCLNTLLNEYGDFGAKLSVLHHTQMLARLIDEGLLRAATPTHGAVAIHDPCYLARVNGISDDPRALLGETTNLDDPTPLLQRTERLPLRVVEPKHHGRKTLCCGAGGGRMWMDETPSERPASRRMQELEDTGAETIAVACPFCRIMLETGSTSSAKKPRLIDLAQLVDEANRD
jgi:Fe-S oxidoreductase